MNRVIFILLLIFTAPASILAHPHIFIDVSPSFVFDDNGLAGITVQWHFDELFSQDIIMSCDKDGDSKFNKEEIENVEKDYFNYAKNSNYFSIIKINGDTLKNIAVKDFQAFINPDKLTVTYIYFIPVGLLYETNITKIQYIANDHTTFVAFGSNQKENSIKEKHVKITKQYIKEFSYYGYEFGLEYKGK
ncbi:MAG: hypothetical protein AUJ85_04750 [Elusimicrobia bacterium CG1_02_37_114]|nr:MAG: hypothetical protein AUJ85_04750 [Elusimicrobia bacterium CG1_02_37_114]